MYSGRCHGGPWAGRDIEAHRPEIRVPLIRVGELMEPPAEPTRPVPLREGVYRWSEAAGWEWDGP